MWVGKWRGWGHLLLQVFEQVRARLLGGSEPEASVYIVFDRIFASCRVGKTRWIVEGGGVDCIE